MPHTNMMVPSGVENATGLNRENEIDILMVRVRELEERKKGLIKQNDILIARAIEFLKGA
jgi:hypothetical protein